MTLFPLLLLSLQGLGSDSLVSCSIEGVAGAVECGAVHVYEDRSSRTGRIIGLNVVVLRALAEPEPDPVVGVVGGPGQAATQFAPIYADRLADLRQHRDIVLVDQRGAGGSNDLACTDPPPSGPASTFGALFPADHIIACRRELERKADLSRYYSSPAADDMADVLNRLGYERANFIGGSYGTRFILEFMRRHPGKVRTAVLNGIAPVHLSPYVWGSVSLQRAFDRLVAQCAADSSCAASFPEFREEFDSLLVALDVHPVTVHLDTLGRDVRFDLGDFAYAVRGMLYGPLAYQLPYLVHDAYETGDYTPFADYYLRRSSWVSSPFSTGMHLSTVCGEDFRYATEAEAAHIVRDTFMGLLLYNRYQAACALWDVPDVPHEFATPVRANVPTLILSGSLDPVTPLEWGDEVASQLENALHIVVEGGGHGVGGECVNGLIRELIRSGELPAGESCSAPDGSTPEFRTE